MPAVENLGEAVDNGYMGQGLVRRGQFPGFSLKISLDTDPFRNITNNRYDKDDLAVFHDRRADGVNMPHLSAGKRHAALVIVCHSVSKHLMDTEVRTGPV